MEQERIQSNSWMSPVRRVVPLWTGISSEIFTFIGHTPGSIPWCNYPTYMSPLKEMACFHMTKNIMQQQRGPLILTGEPSQPQSWDTYWLLILWPLTLIVSLALTSLPFSFGWEVQPQLPDLKATQFFTMALPSLDALQQPPAESSPALEAQVRTCYLHRCILAL